MGTKNNPGQFDCYESAHNDEPIFVLKASDPSAALCVKYWVSMNLSNQSAEKLLEAMKCAQEMEQYGSD